MEREIEKLKVGDVIHLRMRIVETPDHCYPVAEHNNSKVRVIPADIVQVEPSPLAVGDAVRMRVGSPSDNGRLLHIHCGYGTVSFGGRAMPQIIELERLERAAFAA